MTRSRLTDLHPPSLSARGAGNINLKRNCGHPSLCPVVKPVSSSEIDSLPLRLSHRSFLHGCGQNRVSSKISQQLSLLVLRVSLSSQPRS